MSILWKWLIAVLVGLGAIGWLQWSALLNLMLPSGSRPEKVVFGSTAVSQKAFDQTAAELESQYPGGLSHIEAFREAGLLAYEGPKTCLGCHSKMNVIDPESGEKQVVDSMEDLLNTVHYRLFSDRHPDLFGMHGGTLDGLPMGKINRMCPMPGSAAMMAWAQIVRLEDGRELSAGCGQCHIGGQYQAPLGGLLPGYRPVAAEKDAVDCLICHSAVYDMNQRQVIIDDNGRARWGQDRSLRAALTATRPSSQACLRCHQHNMGGEVYVDPIDKSFMDASLNRGWERPRVLHSGSKRGTPFSPSWDVHAAAGVQCIDCHKTKGHAIAKGQHTTSLVANDLHDVSISCEQCHGAEPHKRSEDLSDYLNLHGERVACQTCHIPSLHEDNVTYRDFATTTFEKDPGIYLYQDVVKATDGRDGGIMYVWWNGEGTIISNPIGDNPNQAGHYKFYRPDKVWPEFQQFDYGSWYEANMRPLAKNGPPSKLYPMKRFNGRQHVDLVNSGPFAGMFLPYYLPTYYATGDPDAALVEGLAQPMIKRLYGYLFKYYLLDRFMECIQVDGWQPEVYEDVRVLKGVAPRWMPQDAALEINHAIRLEGALQCGDCHTRNGVLDWQALGYTPMQVSELQENPLEP